MIYNKKDDKYICHSFDGYGEYTEEELEELESEYKESLNVDKTPSINNSINFYNLSMLQNYPTKDEVVKNIKDYFKYLNGG